MNSTDLSKVSRFQALWVVDRNGTGNIYTIKLYFNQGNTIPQDTPLKTLHFSMNCFSIPGFGCYDNSGTTNCDINYDSIKQLYYAACKCSSGPRWEHEFVFCENKYAIFKACVYDRSGQEKCDTKSLSVIVP